MPVLRTTGVNTKILVALELGVPLVITPVRLHQSTVPNHNYTTNVCASESASSPCRFSWCRPPLVVWDSQVAASPFDLPENETIVAFADQVYLTPH